MSILSVDNISPIGSGTSVTVNSAATLVLTNANSTGVVTATTFSGSGASLTNLPAANLTGTLPAISGANLTGVLKNVVEDTSPQLGGVLLAEGNNITFGDGSAGNGALNRLTLGASNDLQIYHGSNISTIIDSYGDLRIMGNTIRIQRQAGGENFLYMTDGGKVSINYDGSTKFETTNTGAVITGICTATTFEATTFSKTPTNTPAFPAYRDPSISPSISDATNTKITFLTHETLDTDSAYDNSSSGTTANRFTVPSGKGGYYNVSAGINFYANNNDIRHARIFIQKNGNTAITAYGMVGCYFAGLRHFQCNLNGILNLNAGDYLELFAYLDVNSNTQAYISNDTNGLRGNHFSAYKLII